MSTSTGVATRSPELARELARESVLARIEKIGVIPVVRVESAEDACFASETVATAGIPLVEISVAVPDAPGVISYLAIHAPDMIVGAGSIPNLAMARRCLDAGARFLASDGLLPGLTELAAQESLVAIPGALTPTEVMAASNTGSDFLKVSPCEAVGGYFYIRSLKAALPEARLIAAGGVTLLPSGGANQMTAANLIAAGASAVAVSRELFPREAIALRQHKRIRALARRFLEVVSHARSQRHLAA